MPKITPEEPQYQRPVTRYAEIEDTIKNAIDNQLLPAGIVVTEDPVARLFGTSRTPVRVAFNKLEERGFLKRFDGRGFVVSGAKEPKRISLAPEMLGLSKTPTQLPQPMTAQRIAADFEASIVQALPFGLYRVHEQAAADHFDVSRTVIRELLSRLQDRGIIAQGFAFTLGCRTTYSAGCRPLLFYSRQAGAARPDGERTTIVTRTYLPAACANDYSNRKSWKSHTRYARAA